ncbi:MAG TPA: YihY/virulence factor BrkB family protein [Kofleriaceae bacterium]|nr:YihY/virulence factor BrkB family protein [Kofleriaceae bacterium]
MFAVRRWQTWVRQSDSAVAHWLRAAHDALLGEMPVLAAGTALFAILATVPTLAAVVGVYGLVADPHEIHQHLRGLESVLPTEVVGFLGEELERQAERSSGELGFAVATSIVVAVYSARGAARALISVLNRAYRVRERRRTLHKILISIAMATITLIGLMLMFGVVVALPGIVALIHLRSMGLVGLLRWPSLMAILYMALLLLYRYGPSPRPLGTERHLWPGALFATVLLILVSWGLSQWVERVSNYALFYGAFGSVVVVLLWFYLSTIALVFGGFLNAELERYAGAPDPDRSMY